MATVDSSTVAVTSVDDLDGFRMHDYSQRNSKWPGIEVFSYPNRTKTTNPDGGQVTDKGVAVPSVDNQDGIRVDYYTPYNGNGSTGDGWPGRDKWISFMDMCV